jgi:hypothetical protein
MMKGREAQNRVPSCAVKRIGSRPVQHLICCGIPSNGAFLMLKLLPCLVIAASSCFLAAGSSSLCGEAGSQAMPTPEIFAPGIISGPANDGSPTFSPNGNTLFFTHSTAQWSIILESHRTRGHWSQPKVAPFSGEWADASPAFSPDGSYLVFVSIRPDPATPPDGKLYMASHIWRVDRAGSGWSAPVELPAAVNCFRGIFRPSIAADGSIYFTAASQATAPCLSGFRARTNKRSRTRSALRTGTTATPTSGV